MLSCVPLLCPAISATSRPSENRSVWTRPKTHPQDQTHKYWNKKRRSCHHAALDDPSIAELSSTSLLLAFSFVGYQWRASCAVDSMIVFHKVCMCWKFCLLRTKHGYTSVDTLIVQKVQHGALKPTCAVWKSSAFVKIGVLCVVSRKRIVGPLFFEDPGGRGGGLFRICCCS